MFFARKRGLLERIGLFGGTFNPIHQGHLRAAEEVRNRFPLGEIYFIPCAIPPHKVPDELASSDDRLEMIQLAISTYPHFKASDVEVTRQGPSFTIDTVRYFESALVNGPGLYLIMGLDAFLELDTWKSYHDLLVRIPFIVMARPYNGYKNSLPGWSVLDEYLKHKISDRYTFSPSTSSYLHPSNQPVHIIDISLIDISSTRIRRHIKTGRQFRSLLPEAVADYITNKGLYL